jgi:Tfp pilus assembly protein PilX
MQPRNPKEAGVALIVALLMMLMLSIMITGLYFMVTGEQKVAVSDRDNTSAFYAAEGGLEQLSASLAQLFGFTASPTATQINNLSTPSYTPAGITYSTFTIGCPNVPCTAPLPSVTEVVGGTGPLAGLQGVVTQFTLTVVADGPSQTEAKLVRQVQEVAVPVFEFGIFSQTDLSFFAGPNFNFGGRVHTNGYLFLAEGNGDTLTLSDKVTAYKDIIRTQLANGWLTSTNYTGTVEAIVTTGGCPGPVSTCRPLASNEGSVIGGPGSAVNPNWNSLSLSTYNGNILNGTTGAKQLNLAIALAGAQPVDLLRRNLPGDSAAVSAERFMNKASVRILLSDTAAALPGNGTNDANGYPAVIPLDSTLNASLTVGTAPPASYPAVTGAAGAAAGIYGYKVDACHPPMAMSPGNAAVVGAPISNANKDYWDTDFATPLTTAVDTPLLGGFIEIDMQPASAPGTWVPVTMEIIQQGIEKSYTNTAPYTLSGTPQTGTCVTGGETYYPIIHLEQINKWVCTGNTTNCNPANRVPGSLSPWDYIPLNTYDTREGSKRDTNDGNIYLNGVMNYVELDMANLQRWFACNGINPVVGSCSGTLALGPGPGQVNEIGGYIVYFSDRRGNYEAGADNTAANPPLVKNETAEYGNEDIINSASSTGAPDGVLDPVNYNGISPEDVNGNGVLDTYGATPDPNVVVAGAVCPYAAGCAAPPSNSLPFATVTAPVAAKNGVVFFRRSLRLYHAAIGQLAPWKAANCTYTSVSPDGYGGFTVASENPVYIQGDYNADSTLGGTNIFNDEAGRCHVPSAVLADAVTTLSNAWNDTNAFNNPTAVGNRNATTTSYRTAVIGGKNISFAQPTWSGAAQDLGTDGGVHNFLRFLENWSGQSYNYRGSIVSFFYAVQATGIYKCCTIVYNPPTRAENFDTDFQSIQTLPPGTPRFTDVNALSFEQALLPYQ